jgi:hypothetical protein
MLPGDLPGASLPHKASGEGEDMYAGNLSTAKAHSTSRGYVCGGEEGVDMWADRRGQAIAPTMLAKRLPRQWSGLRSGLWGYLKHQFCLLFAKKCGMMAMR